MGPLADSIKDSFPLGSQGCWSPNFTVKFKEQRSRSLREQGGLRYKKQERERERDRKRPPQRELDFILLGSTVRKLRPGMRK